MARIYNFKRLILFENDYEDICGLVKIVKETGWIVITKEEQAEENFAIDQCIVERLRNIL